MVDVHVVGAGPAGTVFAREAAKSGLRILVSEEHSSIGEPVQCSGLVSKEGLESLGIGYSGAVLNEIRGADIYSPSLSCLNVGNGKPRAFVVDRQGLDSLLADSAVSAGAEIEKGKRLGMRDLRGRLIVGADGAASSVAEWFRFPKIPEYVICMQAEFEGARIPDQHRVTMFVSNEEFPGLFGWAIPLGGNAVRVGMGVKMGKSAEIAGRFKRFVSGNRIVAGMLSGAREKSRLAGIIPVAVRERTAGVNVLLVGDAAGQVKATTGGGIAFGTAAAKIAAGVVCGGGRPADYERRWRKELGGELALHAKARRLFDSLPDARINSYLGLAKKFGAEEFLNENGSMDSMKSMLSALERRPVMGWMKMFLSTS